MVGGGRHVLALGGGWAAGGWRLNAGGGRPGPVKVERDVARPAGRDAGNRSGGLPPHVWRLLAVRGLRSFTQGYLAVVAPLYLLSLGVGPAALGVLFTASFLVAAALLIPVGVFADRYRRTPFLIAYTLLMAVYGAVYTGSRFVPLLLVVSACSGIGRGGGAGGAQAGPFAPAEQALLADMVPAPQRRTVFGWNAMLSSVMAAAGAGISGLPIWLRGLHDPWLSGDRVLFALTLVLALISLSLLLGLPEPPHGAREGRRGLLTRPSARLVTRQALAGACNAFGVSFVGALFVVWLNLRFHVGPEAIGPVLTATYLCTAGSYFVSIAVARHLGSVRTVVAARVAAVAAMVALPFSPSFLWAAALQVARVACTMSATPVRQAFTMGLYNPDERASAAGITGMARRIPGAVSPAITGLYFDAGDLEPPFFLGAFFLLFSAGLYYRFFISVDEGRGAPEAHLHDEE